MGRLEGAELQQSWLRSECAFLHRDRHHGTTAQGLIDSESDDMAADAAGSQVGGSSPGKPKGLSDLAQALAARGLGSATEGSSPTKGPASTRGSSPARAPPATAGAGRAKATPAKHGVMALMFCCQICWKQTEMTENVPGFNWDRSCKRGYDALARLAKKQGELEWWAEVKGVPKKLKQLVQDFNKMLPSLGLGKARAKGFKMAEYKEYLRSTTEIQRRTMGKMMWIEEWVEYGTSTAGGTYSHDEAIAQWKEWAKPDSGVLRCEDGPAKAPLMLRVKVGTYVDDVDKFAAEKEMSVSNGAVKNPIEVDIAAMREQVNSSHNKVAGMGVGDLSGIASSMLGSASSSGDFAGAFSKEGLTSLSLRDHLIDKASAKEVKAEPVEHVAEDGEAEEGEEAEEPAPKVPKRSYFAADKVNATNVSGWVLVCRAFMTEATPLVEKMHASKEVLEKASEGDAPIVAPTLAVLKSRLSALQLVVSTANNADADLDTYLKKFGAAGCKEAPPIEKYLNLMSVVALQKLGTQLFNACTSHAAVKEAKRQLQSRRLAVAELLTVCRGVLADVRRAVKGVSRLEELGAKITAKDTAATKQPGKQVSIWEVFSEHGVAIAMFSDPPSEHDLRASMDLSSPFIIRGLAHIKLKDHDPLSVLTEAFKKKWGKWTAKTSETRGGRKILDDGVASDMQRALTKLLPPSAEIQLDEEASKCQALADAVAWSHFAMAQGETFSQHEVEGLACVRITREGTRTIACCCFEGLEAFAREEHKLPADAEFTCEQACSFLKAMSTEVAITCCQKLNIFHGTVGPRDMLFIPPAFCQMELTLNKFDVIGFKKSVVTTSASTFRACDLAKQVGMGQETAASVTRLWRSLVSIEAAAVSTPEFVDLDGTGTQADDGKDTVQVDPASEEGKNKEDKGLKANGEKGEDGEGATDKGTHGGGGEGQRRGGRGGGQERGPRGRGP